MSTAEMLLGDCRDLLPISADVCITDPPYAVNKRGEMIGQISANYHEKATHSRGYADHNVDEFRKLLIPAFDGIYKSLPKGGSFVAFGGNRTFHQMIQFAENVGFQMMDILVFTGGGSFAKSKTMLMPRHEVAFFMRKPGGTRTINPSLNIANVFDYPKTRGEAEHPTTKPQSWMEPLIETFSAPGDVVLDPFAGSGSTGFAALVLGRDFVGIESDPEYYKEARFRLRLP